MSLPQAQILNQIQNSNDETFWKMLSGLYFPADGKGFTPTSHMLDSLEILEPYGKKQVMKLMLEKVVSILQKPVDKAAPNRDQFLTFAELFDLATAFSANKDIYNALIEKNDVDYLRKATSLNQQEFKRFAILYFNALLQHQMAATTTEDHLKFWLKYLRYSNDWNIFNGNYVDDGNFNRQLTARVLCGSIISISRLHKSEDGVLNVLVADLTREIQNRLSDLDAPTMCEMLFQSKCMWNTLCSN